MNLESLLSLTAAAAAMFLGGFVLFRSPGAFVHRIFFAGMAVLAFRAVLTGLAFQSTSIPERVSWESVKLLPTLFLPGIWLVFSLSFGRGNYLEFLSRWKWVISAFFLVPLFFLFPALKDGFPGFPMVDESLNLFFRITGLGYALHLFYLIGSILVLMNLERTLRHSIGHTRWQMKFMLLGVGSIFGARIYVDSQVILFRTVEAGLEIVNVGGLLLAAALIARSLWRSRVLKFDIYLSHSFLYNSFTVLLIGIYFIAVGVVAKLVYYFRGSQSPAQTALLVFLAILVLALFLLSDRLRLQRKRFISRHFKRPRYDYPRVWARFTERSASVSDMRTLCANIVRMVSETLEALSVSIWLVDEQEECLLLGASTESFDDKSRSLKITGEGGKGLIQAMNYHPLPVDLRDSTDDWVGALKMRFGEAFEEARVRFCVPLSAAGRQVGILTLGGKISDEPYTFEDVELMKTIADQAAANLLTLRLGERLQQAKEMEAFQVMSAFFTHDLKNLASRLSLVTQNLPRHFANPDFRNDALRTISQSLDKINGMCSRLSMLSQKLELRPREADLNEMVRNALTGLEGMLTNPPTLNLTPIPKFQLDVDQFQSVLVNLLLNARDAVRNGGKIQVCTAMQGNFAALSVSDEGCGMSKEFMDRCLFRPFKTTKKQGMGIGLFHSKKIVEAHQGRIEVESVEGKGTTFTVYLPVKPVMCGKSPV